MAGSPAAPTPPPAPGEDRHIDLRGCPTIELPPAAAPPSSDAPGAPTEATRSLGLPPAATLAAVGLLLAAASLLWAATFTPFAFATLREGGARSDDGDRNVDVTHSFFGVRVCVSERPATPTAAPLHEQQQCESQNLRQLARDTPRCRSYVAAVRGALVLCALAAALHSLLLLLCAAAPWVPTAAAHLFLVSSISTAALLVAWPLTTALYTQLHCDGDAPLRTHPTWRARLGPSPLLQIAAFPLSLVIFAALCSVRCGCGWTSDHRQRHRASLLFGSRVLPARARARGRGALRAADEFDPVAECGGAARGDGPGVTAKA